MWTLDIEKWEWERIAVVGKLQPRCGHTTGIMPDGKTIILYGGWNSSEQFTDIFMLDTVKLNEAETPTLEWEETELGNGIPRWNHCSLMVAAIPSWK